ncbi:rRNA promoter binding protein [Echinococcus granulosus]|uniref:rRNA promoter binding protein n=1 Tax=Echinococcus granulosus TaxID=6210 RepID=W6UPP6_ECHGR|nr:rRNA promoter binding protein [Echinococcus granulosus]EUB55374.1 rRNA promoter binding protein [Echinococcus granulosus]
MSPRSDRLTHVQLLFTWNLSPLQSSKFSFEYLLLPPRSALGAVRPGITPKASSRTPTPAYSSGHRFYPDGENRCEPPPEFPLASPYSGIVHHLSGPNSYAHTQIHPKTSGSVDGAPRGVPTSTGRLRPLCQRPSRSAFLGLGWPHGTLGYKTPRGGVTFRGPLTGRPNRRWPARGGSTPARMPAEPHSQIPLVRTSSKLVVNRPPDGRSLPRASSTRCWGAPAGCPASAPLLQGVPPKAQRARPLEPILIPKIVGGAPDPAKVQGSASRGTLAPDKPISGSALGAVRPGITPKASSRTPTPAYSSGHRFYPDGENRCEPPPEFPLASPYSGIVHHLSGPNSYAHTQIHPKTSGSVDVHRHECRLNPVGESGRKRFPFNNFTCCLTLFSKCFSSFDHSTCVLSGGGGASSSRGARPAPLRAPARPTQPLEPILIPKLRIRLADFPYLHCSNMPEAVHLGDLLRIWVRPGARFTPSPPDFQGPARAHRTPPEPRRFPRHGPLSRGEPIPGRPALHKEKRTLPGAPAGFSGIGCVTALDASRRPSPPLRIRGSEPDSLSIGRGQRRPSPVPSERRSPISQDRLTHICTCGGSTRARALGFKAHRSGPPTRRGVASAVGLGGAPVPLSTCARLPATAGSDDRFARQDRYGPPPEFPLASPCPGIVHHLSGPNTCARAPPPRRGGRDGPVVRPRRTGEASGSHLRPAASGGDGRRRGRRPFTFIAPRRLSCEPPTRARDLQLAFKAL